MSGVGKGQKCFLSLLFDVCTVKYLHVTFCCSRHGRENQSYECVVLYITFTGMPTKEKLRFIDSKEGLKEISRIDSHNPPSFASWFPSGTNPLALDLLSKMLKFNPDDRISVEEALAHPYLKDFHGQMAEPTCDRLFDFEFEKRASGGPANEMTEAEVGGWRKYLNPFLELV